MAAEKAQADEITSKDRDIFNKTLLHPWANLPELGEDKTTSVIVKGEGAYIFDDEGNKLLDGPAGMWCMQTGYGRQEIADAVAKQIMELGYTSPFSVINPQETKLSQRIAAKTPGDLNRIFFTTGGSTAVDSALRLCQLVNNIKDKPQRKHILTREKAYHGSTALCASITGKERSKTALDVESEKVHFLTAPDHYHHPEFESEQQFCDFLIKELEDKINELGADNIMCMIAEPILASGGVIVPPEDYNRRCCETVQKQGIYYIADEVVTGFGRLGHWFVSGEVFNTTPDIITFAKGISSGYVPMGGFAVSDKLMQEISGENAKDCIFSNGYTWSSSPVACAAALASWDIIEKEEILTNVLEVGPYFQQQLRTLKDIPLVGDVRGTGLMAAVEMTLQGHQGSEADLLEKDFAIGAMVDDYCHQFGLLVRPFINICIMSPPLIITKSQVDDMVTALRKAIELTLNELRNKGVWID